MNCGFSEALTIAQAAIQERIDTKLAFDRDVLEELHAANEINEKLYDANRELHAANEELREANEELRRILSQRRSGTKIHWSFLWDSLRKE